jgi:hypothetical protein
MKTPPFDRHGEPILLALDCASMLLTSACGSVGVRSPRAKITRLDGTSIDTISLTQGIEALTHSAQPHLIGRYTSFAHVTSSLEVASKVTQRARGFRVEILP